MDRCEILEDILSRVKGIPARYEIIFRGISDCSPNILKMLMKTMNLDLRAIADTAIKNDSMKTFQVLYEGESFIKENMIYWQKRAIRHNSLKTLEYLLDEGDTLISLTKFAADLKKLSAMKCIMKRMSRDELIIAAEFTHSDSKRVRKYLDSIRDEL